MDSIWILNIGKYGTNPILCTKIENTATAWATAVTAMNAELESYGYRYVANTDSATSATEPLILVKIA